MLKNTIMIEFQMKLIAKEIFGALSHKDLQKLRQRSCLRTSSFLKIIQDAVFGAWYNLNTFFLI
jgi:hypothetical protein